MSVRMRHTRGHSGNRRSHHALKNTNVIKDGDHFRLPHRLDETTGTYRGKQIAPAKASRKVAAPKAKGPDTEPEAKHGHDHAHEHGNAEAKLGKGIQGKLAAGSKPKARSGMGGQAS